MVYRKYYDVIRASREKADHEKYQVPIIGRRSRPVFQNVLRHATRQAVGCFRRANFNNVTSREAQQRRPLPVLERFDINVYHSCASARSFCRYICASIPFFTRLVPSIITRCNIHNWITSIIFSVSPVSSFFFAFAWISSLPQYNASLSIIFKLARE